MKAGDVIVGTCPEESTSPGANCPKKGKYIEIVKGLDRPGPVIVTVLSN
jgi:hypothetical protein